MNVYISRSVKLLPVNYKFEAGFCLEFIFNLSLLTHTYYPDFQRFIMGQASSLPNIEQKTGYYFRNKKLLTEAMSHDSLRGQDRQLRDYQRFEHLGDAVLHFVITNYLFCKYSDWNEGQLSRERDVLVCQSKQQKIATELELHKFVIKSQGVQCFTRYDKFLEALIGAIYIDAGGEQHGYPPVKAVIYKLWELQEPGQAGCLVV